MSESATPDDYDYLSDAPPATDDDETSFVADDEPSVPIARPRPVAEVREIPAPVWPRTEPPNVVRPRPVTPRAPQRAPADVRLGLWGAPRAGKTTYLSALRIAAQKPVGGYNWSISGCDPASVKFLKESVQRFVRDKDFPPATIGYRPLSWRFQGARHHEVESLFGRLRKKLSAGTSHEVTREFIVEMQDAAGESFGEDEAARQNTGVLDHLLNANGIVYVFDPIGNKEKGAGSFDFYYDTVDRLKEKMRELDMLAGSSLPHFVSVCVTKFDHPDIFDAAMKAGIIYQEHEGAMPVVPSSIAPEFLRSLCQDEGSRWVCDTLQSDFLPERVKYFATSSVGFHLNNGKFNLRDYSNVAEDGRHFLSAAAPINVLEPIISLADRVRDQEGMA